MKVEPWPKPDLSPQPWRPECQLGPQPPNYDPYRIKVPETVVPPLPPSNVKVITHLWTHLSIHTLIEPLRHCWNGVWNSAFDEIRAPRRDIKYLMKSSLCFLHQRIHVLNTSSDQQNQEQQQQAYHQQQNQQGYHGYTHHQQVYGEEEPKEPGFLGRIKGFLGRLKGKKDGQGESMMTGNRNVNWLYR